VTSTSSRLNLPSTYYYFYIFLLGLLLYDEDGGGMILRNDGLSALYDFPTKKTVSFIIMDARTSCSTNLCLVARWNTLCLGNDKEAYIQDMRTEALKFSAYSERRHTTKCWTHVPSRIRPSIDGSQECELMGCKTV
jgi:hypothetical protein